MTCYPYISGCAGEVWTLLEIGQVMKMEMSASDVHNPVSAESEPAQDDSSCDALYVKPEVLQKLETWALVDAPTAEEFAQLSLLSKFRLLGGEMERGSVALGGSEGISTVLQLLCADKDKDGEVSTEEEEALAEKLSSDASNLLTNMGVIAALALSIVFPMIVAAGQPSDDSTAYFGALAVRIFELAFYLLAGVECGISLGAVYYSVRSYTIISFWMPSAQDKIWYIRDISLVPLVLAAIVMVVLAAVAIPCGAAAFVSPLAALFATAGLALFAAAMVHTEMGPSKIAMYRLHDRARGLVRERAEKAQLSEDQKVEAILRDAELPEDRAADIRRKLERARLTFRVMHATADLLLNEALKEAGVDYAGERLAIIAAVSKGF